MLPPHPLLPAHLAMAKSCDFLQWFLLAFFLVSFCFSISRARSHPSALSVLSPQWRVVTVTPRTALRSAIAISCAAMQMCNHRITAPQHCLFLVACSLDFLSPAHPNSPFALSVFKSPQTGRPPRRPRRLLPAVARGCSCPSRATPV